MYYRVTAQGSKLNLMTLEFDGVPVGSGLECHRLGDTEFLVRVDGPAVISVSGRTSTCSELSDEQAAALVGA